MDAGKEYCLTDGWEVAAVRVMAEDEFEDAQRAAERCTDGDRWSVKEETEMSDRSNEHRARECAYNHLHRIHQLVGDVVDARNAVAYDPNDRDAIQRLEEAERAAREHPVTILVCSDWHAPGETPVTGEYQIVLETGDPGPGVRILGKLSYGEPLSPELQYRGFGFGWRNYPLSGYDTEDLAIFTDLMDCFSDSVDLES